MTATQTSLSLLIAAITFGPLPTGDSTKSTPTDARKQAPEFLKKGLSWLVEAQFENGGWGAGTHAHQEIRDPRAVQADPATTAFSAMALLRSGSTLREGPYSRNVAKALSYLLDLTEATPEKGTNITTLTGTQPQTKLGQNIDVSMCAQFLSRILTYTTHDQSLKKRVAAALDKCLRKIERGQNKDGSWTGAGWAGVLQSAMAFSALEAAKAAGGKVDDGVLERSREYQKGNIDLKTGTVRTESSAGVSLYSITSNQRATAEESRNAEQSIDEAKQKGLLRPDAPVTKENLVAAGHSEKDAEKLADAYKQNKTAGRMLEDETVISGFGSNGGEEYLSYMMTAESMVISGDKEWNSWYDKMGGRFRKIQNSNGSWTGHHCITSPVFCTAAVILTLTTENDAQVLVSEQKKGRK